MKSLLSIVVAAFLVAAPVQKAHSAAVATAVSFGTWPVAALIPALVFSAPFLSAGTLLSTGAAKEEGSKFNQISGFIALGIGLIILDEEGSQKNAFSKLSKEDALALGVDASNALKFNSRVAAVNQIAKSIAKSCTKKYVAQNGQSALMKKQLSQADVDFGSSCSENAWNAYQEKNPKVLSQDVFDVIQSIRNQNR